MNVQYCSWMANLRCFLRISAPGSIIRSHRRMGTRRSSAWAIRFFALARATTVLLLCSPLWSNASPADDEKAVAALDSQYQEAVKKNDVAKMDRILGNDFILVTGQGQTQTKSDLLKESGSGTITYEHQEDTNRTVRVWGDTAVVTALLWVKGSEKEKTFDYKLWFSDVYVRTPAGWRYVFGQASLRLPQAP
jgi:ketosteroid isomerase-like protein